MFRQLSSLLCLALIGVTLLGARGQLECSVKEPNSAETIFNIGSNQIFQSTADQLLDVIFPARSENGFIRVVNNDDDEGGITGTFWFKEKQRVGEGFKATFEFQVTGGVNGVKSDGFAFVLQNDKIENIQGGTGGDLGFRNGLDKYLAIGFDVCADRLTEPFPLACAQEQVQVEQKGLNGEVAVFSKKEDVNLGAGAEMSNGAKHIAEVIYERETRKLEVIMDAISIFQDTLVSDLETLWGDEFGFFGFTASNLNAAPANIDITGFKLEQLISGTRITSGLFTEVEITKRAVMTLIAVDTCNEQLSEADALVAIPFLDNITCTLTFRDNADVAPIQCSPTRIPGSGAIQLSFDGINQLGDWNLEVRVNGVLTQRMPVNNALTSKNPELEGLQQQDIILICVVIALLVIASAYWIHRLQRYKKKLDENKDNIEMGQVAVRIADIDKNITYNMNPLLGTIDEMREKLAKNEKILAGFNAGEMMDGNYTIEQLEDENRQLRDEMNKLKKQEQEDEILRGKGKRAGRVAGKKRNIAGFDQEAAE